MDALPLHPATERFLGFRLEPGEQVRWASSAQPSRWVRRALPLAALLAGVSGLGGILVVGTEGPFDVQHPNGDPVMFALGLVAPLLVLAGILGLAEHRAKRAAYVITDRRAVILDPGAGKTRQETSFELSQVAGARIVRHAAGGDVLLAAVPASRSRSRVVGFFGVPAPDTPYRLIRRPGAESAAPSPGRTAPPAAQRASYVLPGLIMLLGLIMLGAELPGCWRAAASPHWPTASGLIVRSYVQRYGGGFGAAYRTIVNCTYDVNGQPLVCRRVTFGDRPAALERAVILRQMFPENAPALVHYNPDHPEMSVLLPGISPIALSWPGAAAALLVTGLAFTAHLRQNRWPV